MTHRAIHAICSKGAHTRHTASSVRTLTRRVEQAADGGRAVVGAGGRQRRGAHRPAVGGDAVDKSRARLPLRRACGVSIGRVSSGDTETDEN